MAKKTSAQTFRESAGDNEWKQIVADRDKLSNAGFKEKYGFTWTTVMNDAVEKGYYIKRKDRKIAKFQIDGFSEENILQRSFQISDKNYVRLKKLEDDNQQYTKTAIFNKLLSDALDHYGY